MLAWALTIYRFNNAVVVQNEAKQQPIIICSFSLVLLLIIFDRFFFQLFLIQSKYVVALNAYDLRNIIIVQGTRDKFSGPSWTIAERTLFNYSRKCNRNLITELLIYLMALIIVIECLLITAKNILSAQKYYDSLIYVGRYTMSIEISHIILIKVVRRIRHFSKSNL